LIAIVLLFYAQKDRRTGKVGSLYLILYSVGRFIIEFFRNDYRGSVGILSTSQLISVIILAIGIVMFSRKELPWANKE
jgi:phosphatidylglycerol:prolipoprotein diacylglycerol transferase